MMYKCDVYVVNNFMDIIHYDYVEFSLQVFVHAISHRVCPGQ